jgi:hypothetical protein
LIGSVHVAASNRIFNASFSLDTIVRRTEFCRLSLSLLPRISCEPVVLCSSSSADLVCSDTGFGDGGL